MKTQRIILAVITLCSFAIANAGDVTGLTTFTAGTKAVASQVNGNFTAVKTAVDDNNAKIAALEARIAALEANTVLTLDGKVFFQIFNGTPEVRFHGVNVKITNDGGSTDSVNGVGNLVIGYNASSGTFVDRLGSHNVILGDDQSYPNTETMVTKRILSNENLQLEVTNNMNTAVGASKQISVGSNSSIAVGGDKTVQISGMSSTSVGDKTVQISGMSSTSVGDDVSLDIGGNMNMNTALDTILTVGRDVRISVGKEAEIAVEDELLVKVGKASNVMKKNGVISIDGKDIAIKGSGDVTIKAGKDLVLKGSRILQN